MDSYLGTINIWAPRFAPRGWATCNGALITVQQNAALFALLGAIYGGDSRTIFQLPNLVNRFPFGSISLGQSISGGLTVPNLQNGNVGGSYLPMSTVTSTGTLAAANLPGHTHPSTFTPTTGNVPITVTAPSNPIPVTIPVGSATATAPTPSTLTGNVYLVNAAANAGAALKGIYQTTQPSASVNVVGGTATGNPGGTFAGNVATVTGGTVAVQPNTTNSPTPFTVTGQTAQLPMPPFLAISFIICTNGLYPEQS